jgi:hypothetical protein
MKIFGIQIGGGDEEWQPTLTTSELEAIQAQEDWRRNGGTIDSVDWLEYEAAYSKLVFRGVYLRESEYGSGEWMWDKQKPQPYEEEEEPELRKKFLGLF